MTDKDKQETLKLNKDIIRDLEKWLKNTSMLITIKEIYRSTPNENEDLIDILSAGLEEGVYSKLIEGMEGDLKVLTARYEKDESFVEFYIIPLANNFIIYFNRSDEFEWEAVDVLSMEELKKDIKANLL